MSSTTVNFDGMPYTGVLYVGLMIGADGAPRVVEFNVRFGDPETQPVMLRLKSDLVDLCLAALRGHLDSTDAEWDERASLGVVLAAGGYPDQYRKGDVIEGLPPVESDDCKVFHAGTQNQHGRVVTAGGRVLCACALGDTIAEARERAYACVDKISWQDMYYRRDIGHRAIGREG